eukprot:gene13434-14815_t
MTSETSKGNIEKEALRKLFCGGLAHDTTDDTFQKQFEQFGSIVNAFISRDPKTKESKYFGFITFNNSICVLQALASAPQILGGRGIEVKRATPRENMTEMAHERTNKLFVGDRSGFRLGHGGGVNSDHWSGINNTGNAYEGGRGGDHYKVANGKDKKSGEKRNVSKDYEIFDKVLGTRSIVQFSEVRETNRVPPHETDNAATLNEELTTQDQVYTAIGREETERAPADREKAQPKRTKKKKNTKSAAVNQLGQCLAKTQKMQEGITGQFLEGMRHLGESSRTHTSDTLLQVAKMLAGRNDAGERSLATRKQEMMTMRVTVLHTKLNS